MASLAPHPHPKARLEQYTIDSEVAADVLRTAAYTYDDILGEVVFDFGCGTGRLGIGARLIGAGAVVGVDIDKDAISTARKNAVAVDADVSWILGDIGCFREGCWVVLQNPPFGVQRRRADREFLREALRVARVVYSLHKGGEKNRNFIRNFVRDRGAEVAGIVAMKMAIPPTFPFHTRRKHVVDVDLFRIRDGRRADEYHRIGSWIVGQYGNAKRIVEIGVGGLPYVAIFVKERLPTTDVIATDVDRARLREIKARNPDIDTEFDDVSNPNVELYKGASLIYSIRPPPELIPCIVKVASRVHSDVLVRPLSGEEAGFDFSDWRYLGSFRSYFLPAVLGFK